MTRPDAPGPMRRRGPRPLWLHLTGQAAPPSLASAQPPPMPSRLDPALLAGIASYRRHPYRRTLPDPPAIWAEGDSRLLDYGRRGGLPVLFVPSLINRAYVLDLMPERSMLRWLAAQGVRPLLLDWGWPGPDDRTLDLAGVTERLERAIAAVRRRVVLAGYCMGGLLALAAALRQPRRVRGLALLATPWDFHASDKEAAIRAGGLLSEAEALLAASGTLPIDALQTIFASISLDAVIAKFRAFGRADQDSAAARDFVALEDWLNDGVPLAAPIAREVFYDWYRDNRPGTGAWHVGGSAIIPSALRCPAFAAVPVSDRIVPSATALPLASAMPGAILHRPDAGHIGMVAGPRAEAMLWQPMLHWLRSL